MPYQLANSLPKDAAGCFAFSANPTSVHTSQAVQWINNSSSTITIYQVARDTTRHGGAGADFRWRELGECRHGHLSSEHLSVGD